jgi:hypothetical protein
MVIDKPTRPPIGGATTKKSKPRMSGVIINIIGMASERPKPTCIATCCGNAALKHLTQPQDLRSISCIVRRGRRRRPAWRRLHCSQARQASGASDQASEQLKGVRATRAARRD